jgi:hypothetical protein
MHWFVCAVLLCAPLAQKPIPPERDARRPENQTVPPAGREQPAPTRDRRDAIVDPAKRLRDMANHVAQLEATHRSHTARLERLIEVYSAQGNSVKVQECEELRARWNKRYKGALNAYSKSFTPDAWQRLTKGLGIKELP